MLAQKQYKVSRLESIEYILSVPFLSNQIGSSV